MHEKKNGYIPIRNKAVISRFVGIGILLVGLAMVAYHLICAQYILQQSLGNQNTHLGLALILLFLFRMRDRPLFLLNLLFLALSIGATLFIQFNYQDLDLRAGGSHTNLETVIGVTIIVLVFIGCWQEFGPPLPIVALLFLVYAYFGFLLPEPWTVNRFAFQTFIAKLCMNMEGVYGLLLNVSANFVFLFMVFASLMTATGAVAFFVHLGKFVSRFFRAGSAVMAVVTSGFVGSITGQSAANVAITGSFTIPAMKKAGYKPEQAAGIEAAASSGGAIIPPIMGVAAFLMSGILGVSYFKIVLLAIFPALLYIFSCFCYVIFQGRAMGINEESAKGVMDVMLLSAPAFLLPLAIVVSLFVMGFSPLYVGFWAVVSILFFSLIRKTTRPSFNAFKEGFVKGAKLGSQVAVSCALLGMVVKVVTLTGLGITVPQIVRVFCGDNLLLLLVLTGMISIILGTGLPAATSYILVAVVISPMLVTLGIPIITAHFYCFYFCNFSYITPPVALAAVFASKLARAPYIRTGVEASKVGMAGFIIPFLMVFFPSLLLNFSESLMVIIFKSVSTILVLVGLQAILVGHFFIKLDPLKRAIILTSVGALLCGIYLSSVTWILTGISIFGLSTLWQFMRLKKDNKALGSI